MRFLLAVSLLMCSGCAAAPFREPNETLNCALERQMFNAMMYIPVFSVLDSANRMVVAAAKKWAPESVDNRPFSECVNNPY